MRSIWLSALILACGGASTATPPPESGGETAVPDARTEPTPTPAPAPPRTRDLGAGATFADLVETARALDGQGDGDSDAGCLLRGAGSWRLEADLAVPLRPLPAPVASLAQALRRHSGPVRVLSRWGQRGGGRRAVAVFTMTPRTPGQSALVFVGAEGLVLRSTDGALEATVTPAELGERLVDYAEVVIPADAGTPLDRLASVAAALPAETTVAFGVLLPEDTRLPEPLVPAEASEAGLCPGGLPPTDEAEGRFDAASAAGALADLRGRLARCNEYRSGVGEAAGVLAVGFRIGPGGEVTQACATADAIGDPALRACALQAVQETRFADPGGVVDLALPLGFEADATARQQVLCR